MHHFGNLDEDSEDDSYNVSENGLLESDEFDSDFYDSHCKEKRGKKQHKS